VRPDLTIPAALAYLEKDPACANSVKLCYAGPVFRHDPGAAELAGQSLQAGVEHFNAPASPDADIEVLLLTHQAVLHAGLNRPAITLGDVSLFRGLLDALRLPQHWASKIRRHAWHPQRLRQLLKNLSDEKLAENEFVAALKGQSPERARDILRDALTLGGIKLIGTRSFDEIADRFIARASGTSSPLSPAVATLLESFLALKSPASAAVPSLKNLCSGQGISIDQPLEELHKRLQLLSSAGVDLATVEFATQFGRNMEYYSGFIFEVRAASASKPVAGGGRYDDLLSALGAKKPTPAIGLAVFCDRLASAVAVMGGRS
jgi:ATP phosphoribosyltransferase regulatory subunit